MPRATPPKRSIRATKPKSEKSRSPKPPLKKRVVTKSRPKTTTAAAPAKPRTTPAPARTANVTGPFFGSHLSIAGSMVSALHDAERLGLDGVQVFTKNQQQWKAKPLDPAMVEEWRTEQARLGWNERTVSHASYLINLASVSDELFAKSVDLMTDEIERCETLGIPFLVHHPGSSVGWTREQGIARIARAYVELFKRTKGSRTVSCLEGTVGAGSTLGGPFEDLQVLRARIIEATGEGSRVGFCLDTCHMHAAGHDLSTRAQADAVLDRFDELCGLANVRVMHLNDSKGDAGSKLDRHEHIGAGTIGQGGGKGGLSNSGFAAVVNRPELRGCPMIMETPKGHDADGQDHDLLNVARLRGLVG
ncbi:MAG: deoxyribonuclease IV [Phycisphaerales bacterium]